MSTNTKHINNIVNNLTAIGHQDNTAICETMQKEHRTHQQDLTRFCLAWLETVAAPEYKTDGRNESSAKIAGEIINHFKKEEGLLPSRCIPRI